MQGYNIDFAMSASISVDVVKEMIKNTVEKQTGKTVSSVKINFDTVTRGFGVTEYDATECSGVTVYFAQELKNERTD